MGTEFTAEANFSSPDPREKKNCYQKKKNKYFSAYLCFSVTSKSGTKVWNDCLVDGNLLYHSKL